MNARDDTLTAAVGAPVRRLEDLRLLRGEGTYVDDLHAPRMLYAAVVRSDQAHGLIRGIDASAALRSPGVQAVYQASDVIAALGCVPRIPMRLAPQPELEPFQQPVIADGRVRYVGEPVAVILADSLARAEDARELVRLDIEPLPVVTDRDQPDEAGAILFAPAVSSNRAFTFMGISGDADAAFARADYVRKERFEVQRHAAMTMETRGLLAWWEPGGKQLQVRGACKVAFDNRRMLAKMLQVDEGDIEMQEPDVGGSFGMRGEFYPEDFLIPFAARRVGRPVKWIEDRHEHMLTANHARDTGCDLEIACTRDGIILALRGVAHTDIGAYIRTNGSMASRNIAQVSVGPYRIENVKYAVTMVVTNKTPVGTYRGPGRFETDFFRERLFDLAAADLGVDRVEFRRRNLMPPEGIPHKLVTLFPGGDTLSDSGDYRVTLERCLELFDWENKVLLNARQIDGRRHGVAIACYLEGGGIGPKEHARVVAEPDGRFMVYVGASGNGQGLETVMAQIAADALAVPLHRIRGVRHGSTTDTKDGFGAYSSRSTVMAGSAVHQAALELVLALRRAAAQRLGCAEADVLIAPLSDDEHSYGCGGSVRSVRLTELLADGPMEVEAVFTCAKRTYSYGAHAVHVAIDEGTGHVAIVDYVAVEDVGRIVNPVTLHGQTVGAVVQGLGGVFLEHLKYDSDGQLLSGTLADYLLPGASDFTCIRTEAMERFPSPHNPLGVKGAGEGGIISVGGVVANAIAAALHDYGANPNVLPLSPERVCRLIAAGRA